MLIGTITYQAVEDRSIVLSRKIDPKIIAVRILILYSIPTYINIKYNFMIKPKSYVSYMLPGFVQFFSV